MFFSASWRAVSSPIPRLAPVMRAIFFRSELSIPRCLDAERSRFFHIFGEENRTVFVIRSTQFCFHAAANFFDVLAAVERGDPKIAFSSSAKSRAGRDDDIRFLQHLIKHAPGIGSLPGTPPKHKAHSPRQKPPDRFPRRLRGATWHCPCSDRPTRQLRLFLHR